MEVLSKGTEVDPLGALVQGVFVEERQDPGFQSRSILSNLTRTVVKDNSYCKQCAENDDPRKVPVHPRCQCNVATENVQIGQVPHDHPNFRAISTANEEIVFLGENDLPAAITLDPATTGVLDIEDLRFGDLARWLEQVEPLLSSADTVLTIMDEFQENVGDAADVVAVAAEGAESAAEAIKTRRIWFGLSKVVAGL